MEKGFVRLLIAAVVIAVVSVAFISCYPDHGLTTSDYDAVATFYNKSADFGSFANIRLVDTVLHIVPEGSQDDITRDYDDLMLTTVQNNLTARGYTVERNLDTTDIDAVVFVSVTSSKTYVAYGGYNPCYWGWYYYGCGWSYPPYYGGVYSYETGTMLIDMFDGDRPATPGDRIDNFWVATMNGLVGKRNPNSTIPSLINQAFAQSPYLHR
jgi:hypothetical protein